MCLEHPGGDPSMSVGKQGLGCDILPFQTRFSVGQKFAEIGSGVTTFCGLWGSLFAFNSS